MNVIKTLKDTFNILTGRSEVKSNRTSFPKVKYQSMLDIHKDTIERICKEFLHSENFKENPVDLLIERLLAFVLDLPVAKASADSLFAYSLRVAIHSLDIFGTVLWDMKDSFGIRDPVKTRKMEDLWRLGVFVSALMSKVGRVYDFKVIGIPSKPKESIGIWVPYKEGLYEFATRYRQYDIKWKETPKDFYQVATVYFLSFVVDNNITDLMGREVFLEVLDSLSVTPRSDNRIFKVVKEAIQLADTEVFKPQEMRPIIESITEEFCQMVREFYCSGSKKWMKPNADGSYMYIGDTYTAIDVSRALGEVYKKMGKKTGSTEILNSLQKSGIIFSWKEQVQFKVEFTIPEGHQDMIVIFVRNDILWKNKERSLFAGGFRFIHKEGEEKPSLKFITSVPDIKT